MRRIALITVFLLLLASVQLRAAEPVGRIYVQGIVVDDATNTPLPYASVLVDDGRQGTVADDNGIFAITVAETAKTLHASYMGYDKASVPLKRTSHNLYQIRLKPAKTQLNEVVVYKQKYSKKNNPAVDFLERLKRASDDTDPLRHPYYGYDRYEKISFGLNEFNIDTASALIKKLPYLVEHVDTSEVSGKTVLNLSVNEKASHVYYRKDPETLREVILGRRNIGADEVADKESLQVLYEDVLREIDLYQNDINLLKNRFVSPMSRIAPDFYKFYLTDTVAIDGEQCIVLSFYPHNKAYFGFVGHVYVPVADTTMSIRRVEMRKPSGCNVNFIDNLYIQQDFRQAPDGTRLKVNDMLTIEASVLPGLPKIYVNRYIAYDNYSFDAPADTTVFGGLAKTIVMPDAEKRDDQFWEKARLISITGGESKISELLKRLKQNKVIYWGAQVLKVLFKGYIPTAKESKFDYGPVNTSVSYNDVEGVRFRTGGMTTANLSPHWFARGYLAYGLRDRKFKYRAELEYSFNKKKYHSREFPMNLLRASYMYDVDQLGQHYLFTNKDNFVLSLKRMKDVRMTYHQVGRLDYILELQNNFSIETALQFERQIATPWVEFRDGLGNNFRHYDETSLILKLRYAPGEKFYQTKSERIPINDDAPVFVLEHTFAPKGLLGSMFTVNKTELNVSKRFWFSAFGYLDARVGAGHVWSRSPYVNLLLPNANLSYTIQPQSYSLMNPLEFINSSYLSWDVAYWANGALFNLIPGFKKLKLREVVAVNGLWGHLAKRNDPTYNPDLFLFPGNANAGRMGKMPYMEATVGLDNIFKCLRVDYVWRLSYRYPGYTVDRRGIRVALHITF